MGKGLGDNGHRFAAFDNAVAATLVFLVLLARLPDGAERKPGLLAVDFFSGEILPAVAIAVVSLEYVEVVKFACFHSEQGDCGLTSG